MLQKLITVLKMIKICRHWYGKLSKVEAKCRTVYRIVLSVYSNNQKDVYVLV